MCCAGYTGQLCDSFAQPASVYFLLNNLISSEKLKFITNFHSDPCLPMNPCLNNGNCIPDGMGGFKCMCTPDFTGTKCEQSKNN